MSGLSVFGQVWRNDPFHSKVTFVVTHLMVNDIHGVFDSLKVELQSSRPDFSDAKIRLSILTRSINTGVERRDNHLRSEDFFNAGQFPEISFNSTGIKVIGKNRYKVSGSLTIHGVTKPIVADMLYRGSVINPHSKKNTAGIQVTASLKRSDFGVGPKFPFDEIRDDVRIRADGEFVQDAR